MPPSLKTLDEIDMMSETLVSASTAGLVEMIQT